MTVRPNDFLRSDPPARVTGETARRPSDDSRRYLETPNISFSQMYNTFSAQEYIERTEDPELYYPPHVLRQRFRVIKAMMECKMFWLLGFIVFSNAASTDNGTNETSAYPSFTACTFLFLLCLIYNRYWYTTLSLIIIILISGISALFNWVGSSLFMLLIHPFKLATLPTLAEYICIGIAIMIIYELAEWYFVGRKWSLNNPYKACSESIYRYPSRDSFYKDIQDYFVNNISRCANWHGRALSNNIINYVREVYNDTTSGRPLYNEVIDSHGEPTFKMVQPKQYIEFQLDYHNCPERVKQDIDSILEQRVYADQNERTLLVPKYQLGDVRPHTQKTRMPVITELKYYKYTCDVANSWFNGNTLRRISHESNVTNHTLLCVNLMQEMDLYISRNSGEVTLANLINYVSKRENYLITTKEQTDQILHATRRSLLKHKIIENRIQDQLTIVSEDINDFQAIVEANKWKRMIRNTDRRLTRFVRTSPFVSMVLNLSVLIKMFTLIVLMFFMYFIYQFNLHSSPEFPTNLKCPPKCVISEGEIYGQNANFTAKVSGKELKPDFKQLRHGQTLKDPTWTFKMADSAAYNDSLQRFDLHNIVNQDAAVVQRVATTNVTDNYDPDYQLMETVAKEIANELRPHIRSLEDLFNHDALVEYINNRPGYTLSQKKNIIKKFEAFEGDTIQEILKKCRYHAFIKDEAYPKNNRPRAIMACDDLLKVIAGSVFGEIGEALFSTDHCIKLIPIGERPAYIETRLRTAGDYVYQTDHTAFESAATSDMQRHTEWIVYTSLYPELQWLFDYMRTNQTIATGYGDQTSLFYIPCSRWSGAPNTSLGNTLLNMIFIRMVSKRFNVTIDYLVEGDDGLVVSQQELDIDKIHDYAERQGFDLKMERKDSINTAGFLSTVWSEDLVPDVQTRWRYLESSFTFRIDKVKSIGYWNLLSARLLSATLHMPKSGLIRAAFAGAYRHANGKMCIERSWWNIHYFEHEMNMKTKVINEKCAEISGDIPEPATDEEYMYDNTKYSISKREYIELSQKFISGNSNDYFKAYVRMTELYYDREFDYASDYVFDQVKWGQICPWVSGQQHELKRIQQQTNDSPHPRNSGRQAW